MQLFLIYSFLKCSTCFRQFLRPSSGAHNCTHNFRYCQPLLLLVGIVVGLHLSHHTSRQQYWLTIPEVVCTVTSSWWWADEPPETCRAF